MSAIFTQDATLERRVQAIVEVSARGDDAAALDLIEQDVLSAWYGFDPAVLRDVLERGIASGHHLGPTVQALYAFLFQDETERAPHADAMAEAVHAQPAWLVSVMQAAQALVPRLQGRADTSLRLLAEIEAQQPSIPPLVDSTRGWGLMLAVQNGLTAMLAGDYRRALTYLSAAQFHPLVPRLAFLTRDAYVKGALIHAFVGDRDEARLLLLQSESVPRTVSWAEELLDAHVGLVAALLEDDPVRAVDLIQAVQLRAVGEIWPLYALSLQRVFARANRHRELSRRVLVLEKLPFPKVQGRALTGSALELVRALMCLEQNEADGAGRSLALADPAYVGTVMLAAQLDLHRGRTQHAMQALHDLADQVHGLRQLEVLRLAMLAHGYLRLSRVDQAVESLQHATGLLGKISARDLSLFSADVQRFAAAHFAQWPKEVPPRPADAGTSHGSTASSLTRREREILDMLQRDLSRAQMAAELFISLNTLKSHLRAIYRKLGVSDRHAAVVTAGREKSM